MLPPKAPSDEGAVAIGDWGREIYWDYLFFSPSGTPCHLPHQREAWVVQNLKQLDKLEFVCDIITEIKDSVGIINHKREEACLFVPLPIEYTQPGIPGGKE